jgi:hypothetical protein
MTTKKSKSKTTAKHQTTAPNQSAAASAWGVPIAVLRAAKAAGCDAFTTSGRIHREPFMAWLKSNSDEATTAAEIDISKAEKTELEKERLRAQIILLRSKNDREQNTVILRTTAVTEWARSMAILQEEFKLLMDDEKYAIACDRAKSRIGEMFPE